MYQDTLNWHAMRKNIGMNTAFFQATFLNQFSWMKIFIFWLKLYCKFVSKVPIENKKKIVQQMSLHWTSD